MVGRDTEKSKKGKGKWKFMREEEMLEMAERGRPYRSVLCWYLWKVGDTVVEAMGKKVRKKRKVEEEEGGETVEKVKRVRKTKTEVKEEEGEKVIQRRTGAEKVDVQKASTAVLSEA